MTCELYFHADNPDRTKQPPRLTPMNSLPLDLLRPIVESLGDHIQSLLAISLTSRELRAEGQRILFRRMTLPKDLNRHIKFLIAITSSSLLAPLVKEYHQFDLLDQCKPLWGLTCRGLQAMVNLKILHFRSSSGHPSAQILHGCTFQLEVFKWDSCDDAKQLLEFLINQARLRTLKFNWKGAMFDTSGICPGLQVLHGNRYTINAFLPGRRVISLKWAQNLLLNHSVDHLSEEFHHIRFLSFGNFWGLPRLALVNRHLRMVEVLQLVGLSLAAPVCWNNCFLRLRTLSH